MSQPFTQKFLDQSDPHDMWKIVITNNDVTVKAPLPADFGVTVGSEYSSPFDTMSLSENLQKILAIRGISRKAGIKMKKFYVNPEMTEISFDMEFNAYYSAKEEVMMPIYSLMVMGVGKDVTWEAFEAGIVKVFAGIDKGVTAVASAVGIDVETDFQSTDLTNPTVDTYAARVLDLIGIIQGPQPVTIRFGSILTISDAFIGSVSPRFGNILDPNGLPQSAVVSVTCIVQEAPTSGDPNSLDSGNIESWFIKT